MEAEYDTIILGAGAAGLSAGLYTARAMMKTLPLGSRLRGKDAAGG